MARLLLLRLALNRQTLAKKRKKGEEKVNNGLATLGQFMFRVSE